MSAFDRATLRKVLLSMGWAKGSDHVFGHTASSYLQNLMSDGEFELLDACLSAFDPEPVPAGISKKLVEKAYEAGLGGTKRYGGKSAVELASWLAQRGFSAGLEVSKKSPPKGREGETVYTSGVLSGMVREVMPVSPSGYGWGGSRGDKFNWDSIKKYLDQFDELNASSLFDVYGSMPSEVSRDLLGTWDKMELSGASLLEIACLCGNQDFQQWCQEHRGPEWALTRREALLVSRSKNEGLCRTFLGMSENVLAVTFVNIAKDFDVDTATQISQTLMDGCSGVEFSPMADVPSTLAKIGAQTLKSLIENGHIETPNSTVQYDTARAAASFGAADVLEYMIELGLDVNQFGSDGGTLLHAARTPQVVKVLTAAGLDINTPGGYKRSMSYLTNSGVEGVPAAFYWASMDADNLSDMLNVAYEEGANLSQKVNGRSILQWAAARPAQVKDTVRSLLAREKLGLQLNEAVPTKPTEKAKPSPF